MRLARLLDPVTTRQFFASFEKDVLHIARNDPSFFGDLFSFSHLDHLISSLPDNRNLKIVRTSVEGVSESPGLDPQGKILLQDAYEHFARGYSIAVDRIHDVWKPVSELSHDLRRELGCDIAINLYCSPPDGSGFIPHWDDHDVLVLQLEGEKSWSFFEGGPVLPFRSFREQADRWQYARVPTRKVLLKPGDTLYIPRGFYHQATAASQGSLHLTVGLRPLSYKDLVIAWVEQEAGRNPRWRQSIFPHATTDELPLLPELQDLLDTVPAATEWGPILDRLYRDQVRAMSLPPDGHFRQLINAGHIDAETVFEKRPDTRMTLTDTDGGKIELTFAGSSRQYPETASLTLNLIAERDHFRAPEVAGFLDETETLILLRHLHARGLIRVT